METKGTPSMCFDGLKSGWSEIDKPPISEAQDVWAQNLSS